MITAPSRLDATIEIVTPENIAFHYRVAGPFRRWVAYLFDLGVRGVVVSLLGVVFILLVVSPAGGPAIALFLISLFVLEWFYGGLFETYMNGQTPGKWLMGIRVLTVEGQPVHGLQAVLRNVLRVVDMSPLLSVQALGGSTAYYFLPTFVIGLVAMSLNRRFQRLGDVVCGTMVVIEERHWLTGVAQLEDPRTASLAEYLPADFRVSRSLARALATYVDRRRFFAPERRREIAGHLAEPLLRQFGLPRDTSYDLLLCALYYRTFIADRGDERKPRGESPFAVVGTDSAAPRETALFLR
jgi:uncharacterized RDD family membrane protein YckC